MDICFIALCKVPCVLQNRIIVTATYSVNVVCDLDVFPPSLCLSSGHCIVFRTGISQQVTCNWSLLYLGTPGVLCQEFVTNLRHAVYRKDNPSKVVKFSFFFAVMTSKQ